MPSWPRLADALTYAVALHADQRRKLSDSPYVAHLLGVASLVLEHGADEDEAIAALLHDAVEDQGGAATREEIRRRFGDRVVEIVDGCSDTDVTPKPPWRPRKEAYLAQLRTASASVRLVVAADKLHNVRSLVEEYRRHGEVVWTHFRAGREGMVWYYRSVVDTLKQTDRSPLVGQLDRAVAELERLAISSP